MMKLDAQRLRRVSKRIAHFTWYEMHLWAGHRMMLVQCLVAKVLTVSPNHRTDDVLGLIPILDRDLLCTHDVTWDFGLHLTNAEHRILAFLQVNAFDEHSGQTPKTALWINLTIRTHPY
ncbi:hypothetical protein N9741_04210 [Octadecabacter sp.]|nr:hypothetical protein [Octadecabacter sp.]